MVAVEDAGMAPETIRVAGRSGAPDVPLYVYNKASENRKRPAVYHIHGGGMILGSVEWSRTTMAPLLAEFDMVGVSVGYRLAPGTPFPGPQEDCYAGLEWMVAHADDLGIDPGRIVVVGESAGGGLAAALAHMVRDRGDFQLAGQVLIYPMLDCRTGSSDDCWDACIGGEFGWTPSNNQFGWSALRGDYVPDDERKAWFSPSLAEDLSGLPPSFIAVGALDLFVNEDIDYARRLTAAGVPVEFHLYPSAMHGFDAHPTAWVSQQARRDRQEAMKRLLRIE